MAHSTSILRSTPLTYGLLLIAVIAGQACVAPGQGSPGHPKVKHDAFKHQVQQLEATWRDAQLNGDVNTMDKLLSDDYVGISMNGQVLTKQQQLDRVRTRTLLVTKMVLEDVKVKLIGTTAIVTSLAAVEGTNEGSSIRGNYRYTRVYTHLANGLWKITNFEATRVGGRPPEDASARKH